MISLSYSRIDIETRYEYSEHQYLIVIRYLTEVTGLVNNDVFKILIYLDHYMFQNIFLNRDSKKARINT